MAIKTNEAIQYWNDMRLEEGYSCPNVSLFRFLGYAGISLTNKNVLEIGFGANRGKDLLECQKRGAKIWGVDINQSYIEDFRNTNPQVPIKLMNAGTDEFPFDVRFDLIFHRDVIYYLGNEQIEFHFQKSYANLNIGGYLLFQFIENDLTVDVENKSQESKKVNFEILKNANKDKMFRGEINPLRTLDIDWLIKTATRCGFNLISTKTHIESYTPDESVFRIDRYLLVGK